MPDHLRAFIVVLAIATAAFAIARPATGALIGAEDFARRRGYWFAITAVAYLSHNFWVCMVLAGALLAIAGSRDRNPVALYGFLLFALPPLPDSLPTLGVINRLFDLDYLRLLSLTVLLPAAVRLSGDSEGRRFGTMAPDRFLLAYLAYQLVLVYFAGTFTHFLRTTFLFGIDVLLPYYVATRALRTAEGFRDALASFVVGAGVMAAIGIFETAKGWLLYSPLKNALGVEFLLNTLKREELQRAMASTGQPIVFGYVMVVATGFWLYLQSACQSPWLRRLPFLLFTAALVASLSRGPWVGAACLLLVFALVGHRSLAVLLRYGALAAVAIGALAATPLGDMLIRLLPFVGDSADETVSYRQQLFEFLVPVILDHPITGASWYLFSPAVENLRQGEGIIDVVNSFIGIGLSSGLVGLVFFAMVFVSAGVGVVRVARRAEPDAAQLAQALAATLVGILVTIYTVSSISVIPYIYWLVAGICAACTHGFVVAVPQPVRAPLPIRPGRRVRGSPART
jgi:O-antigen ligase